MRKFPNWGEGGRGSATVFFLTTSLNRSFSFLDFSVCDDILFHYFLLLLLSMMINKQSGRASVAQKKRWGRAAQNNNCY